MSPEPLDLLVVAAHPDDAEICVGGVLLDAHARGMRTGIVDVTRGEMGTRGTQADRDAEAEAASQVLGLSMRANLQQPDGRVSVSIEAREALAAVFRHWRPRVVIAQHTEDLHPDHAATGLLAREAWYLAGLKRLAERSGEDGAHRPARLLHFMGHVPFEPTVVVPIDHVWERKVELIRCFATQLEPAHADDRGQHFLFGTDILARAELRARVYGERIGSTFGEPLLHRGPFPLGVDALLKSPS